MKARIMGLAVFSAVALAGTAFAGLRTYNQVSLGANYAEGGLGDARASANGTEYIGCRVGAYSSGSSWAYCFARDQYGNTLSCTSFAPQFVTAAASIGPTAIIAFWTDGSGGCSNLQVTNASHGSPVAP